MKKEVTYSKFGQKVLDFVRSLPKDAAEQYLTCLEKKIKGDKNEK